MRAKNNTNREDEMYAIEKDGWYMAGVHGVHPVYRPNISEADLFETEAAAQAIIDAYCYQGYRNNERIIRV